MSAAAVAELSIPEEMLQEIAERAARIVAEQLDAAERDRYEGYLPPAAAAHYLGVSRQRIYQLTSARVLHPVGRDGRTPLYTRASLDDYVLRNAARSR